MSQNQKKLEIDKRVFIPTALVIFSVAILIIAFPESSGNVVNGLLGWITNNLDWLYQGGTLVAICFMFYVAFSKYGRIKLGSKEDKPEFTTLSWIAMLLCGGIGSGLLYWAIAEPIYYLQGPPFGIEAMSLEATKYATAYGMFHWGISAWTLYGIFAIGVSYTLFVRKDDKLRLSSACRGVLGNRVDGVLGNAIDVVAMFGLIGGVGTGLGLGAPLLSESIAAFIGIARTTSLDIIVVVIWTGIFGTSVYLGLHKGIKVLSDLNVYIAVGLMIFTLVVGPTRFMLSNFVDSFGVMVDDFVRMSTWTDPVLKSGFPQAWTVFYWAWWLAYGPFMGLFVARISKGRTIKQVILGMLFAGSGGCWIFFMVFGGYALDLQLNGGLALTTIMAEQGTTKAIVATMTSLPMSKLVLFLFIIVEFIFMATTMDSAAYVLASTTTKSITADQQPARLNRIFWALALACVGIAVLLIGSLQAIQTSSVIVSLPLVVLAVIVSVSFIKDVKEDVKNNKNIVMVEKESINN